MSDQATLQQTFDTALTALKGKERLFVIEYLRDLHGQNAAIRAGYSEKTARSQASRMLTNVNIRAAVDAGIDLYAMPSAEILFRLSAQARGSIADVLRLPPLTEPPEAATDPLKRATIDDWAIDLVKAQQTGAIQLVKKIEQGEHGPKIELYSAFDALVQLGKARKLFVERTEVTGKDGAPIAVVSAADLAQARAKAQAWEEAQDG